MENCSVGTFVCAFHVVWTDEEVSLNMSIYPKQ